MTASVATLACAYWGVVACAGCVILAIVLEDALRPPPPRAPL